MEEAISRCMSVKTVAFVIVINVAVIAALTVHPKARERLGKCGRSEFGGKKYVYSKDP